MDDFWNSAHADLSCTRKEPQIRIKTSEPLRPLGSQFGVYPKKLQPDWAGKIFAEVVNDNGDKDTNRKLYAILDAAKVFGLLERLADLGARHQSLLGDEDASELDDVAPHLVELTLNSALMCDLLSCSDLPHHLWDLRPGCFVSSDLEFEELHAHLARLTRVEDDDGVTYFFRFWEGTSFLAYAQAGSIETASSLLPQGTEIICWHSRTDEVRFVRGYVDA